MKVARRFGSLLLVHAGVDDTVAEIIATRGVDGLNDWYRRLVDTDLASAVAP